MECFIKKIFDGKIDERVHQQFVRFGKGEYSGRAALKCSKTAKIKLGGSFEYANDFVEFVAESGGGKVSGIVLTKNDISDIMSQNNVKGNSETKKGGMFYENNIEEQELNESIIKILVDNSYFALLDIDGQGFSLKTKKKLPKPGKSGESKIDDKFCVLEQELKYWPRVKQVFFWDTLDFKKARVIHTYSIAELLLPQGEKDFEKIRVLTKRKGIITRKIEVDGQAREIKKEFEA